MLSRMQRWIAAALLAAALAAGCYRSSPPPAPEPPRPVAQEPQSTHAGFRAWRPAAPDERSTIADAIEKLGQFADDMCACTDKTCVDTVTQELTRWSAEMSKTAPNPNPSPEEMELATRAAERLGKCMTTAMSAGSSPAMPTP
jgi:hypothetical protein